MNVPYKYPGEELALFEKAVNWKKYFARFILPFIKGEVLEVGAGTGSITPLLNLNLANNWNLLEPDEQMHKMLIQRLKNGELPANCRVLPEPVIADVASNKEFDCIIYIDVLEHIADDQEEIQQAVSRLKKGGHLVVLSPAFQFLYSTFDKNIGHFRRYNKKTVKALTLSSVSLVRCFYLDSTGFFASLANKLFLRQSYPTRQQISTWDNTMIPISKIVDHIFFYSFGKSILAVWKKS